MEKTKYYNYIKSIEFKYRQKYVYYIQQLENYMGLGSDSQRKSRFETDLINKPKLNKYIFLTRVVKKNTPRDNMIIEKVFNSFLIDKGYGYLCIDSYCNGLHGFLMTCKDYFYIKFYSERNSCNTDNRCTNNKNYGDDCNNICKD